MPNFERGVYEPSDEVRVFDGSEDDEDVEGSRLPLLIVLALLVLAMFGGVVWLAYTQGVARGRSETPILTAAQGPERVAPQGAGGATVPYQGFKIYEQPAPADDAGEPAAAAEAPKPEASKPAPVEAPKPAAQVAPVAKPVPAAPPPPAMKQSLPVPAPVKAAPVAAPSGPATAPPRSLSALVQATSAPATKPAPAKPAATGGAYTLQIGAYKSDAEAMGAWKTYQARHAALLNGYGPDVQRADLGDKGTWYRLRIAGFADREVALALCDRLKADGGGCFLGK